MKWGSLVLLLCVALVLPGAAGAQPTHAEDTLRTTLDGVYTEEQAERGRRVYMGVCVECHAQDEYRGEMMAGWAGAPLYDLFDTVARTMPEDNPGSLRRRDYVDVVAFILALNDMPAGEDPLSSRASILRKIIFKWSEGS